MDVIQILTKGVAFMFNNIGKRLQTLAKITCWIGIIASVIWAIVLWTANSSYESTILSGFLVLIFGCLGSWIGSWSMYALGEATENAIESAQNTVDTYNLLLKQVGEIEALKEQIQKMKKAE